LNSDTPVRFDGATKVAVCNRLGSSWRTVADLVGVQPWQSASFAPGHEPRGVWEWLESQNRLDELEAALREAGREDLADLLLTARPRIRVTPVGPALDLLANDLPPQWRHDVTDVLRGLDYVDDLAARGAGDIVLIDVLRQIATDRDGTSLFEVHLHPGAAGAAPRQRVVKLAPFAAVAAEWRAYRRLGDAVRPLAAPIEAVSRAVIDDAGGGKPDDRATAVVYRHTTAYMPALDRPSDTLDGLVRSYLDGGAPPAPVLDTLRKLGHHLHTALWRSAPSRSASLGRLNRMLGPDLVLEVDDGSAGELRFGSPAPHERAGISRASGSVLMVASTVGTPPVGYPPLQSGTLIELSGLSTSDGDADRLPAAIGDLTVEIRRTPGAALDLSRFAHRPDLTVVGRVVSRRGESWWATVRTALPAAVAEDGCLAVEGHTIGDPFGPLAKVLTEVVPGRTVVPTHGALDPRNVLAAGLPLLTDFSHADERPPLSDLAWLEWCLVRDTVAPRLDWPGLVQLQRLLGLTSRVADEIPDRAAASAADALVGRETLPRRAFTVLWEVRSAARRYAPGGDGTAVWWREYQRHLLLGALRALPTEAGGLGLGVAAAVATAGVAAEWLTPDPYRWWPAADMRTGATAVIPMLEPGAERTADTLADLVTAVDRAGAGDEKFEQTLARCRGRLVAARFHEPAGRLYHDRQEAHDRYIRLAATHGDSKSTVETSAVEHGIGAGERDDVLALVADRWEVVLLGNAGAGKSTVARELQYQLTGAVLARSEPAAGGLATPLLPLTVRAADLQRALAEGGGSRPPHQVLEACVDFPVPRSALAIGAVHLTVDALDEVEATARTPVARWVRGLRAAHPRVPVLVCHRLADFDRAELPFPVVVLRQPSDPQIREYVRASLRLRGLAGGEAAAAGLAEILLDRPEGRRIRGLARTPLFLWMLTERYPDAMDLPGGLGDLFADFSRWWLGDRPGRQATRHGYQELVSALETLARHLVEAGDVVDIEQDTAGRALSKAGVSDPTGLLDALTGVEMLERDGDYLRFRHRSFQEYFAARVLARELRHEQIRDRVLRHRWHDPLRLVLTYGTAEPGTVRDVIDAALAVDPRLAGTLLTSADAPPEDVVTRFLTTCRGALLHSGADDPEWGTAAAALAALGTPAARRVLHAVAADFAAAVGARAAALAALLETPRAGGPDLTGLVTGLLAPPTPTELRVRGAEAVGRGGLRDLAAQLALLVAQDEPWPVVWAAWQSLRALGQVVPVRRFAALCARRLERCEGELRAASDQRTIDTLQDERRTLVAELAAAGQLAEVLARRFSYGLAVELDWPDLLAPERYPEGAAQSPTAWRVLSADHRPEALLEWFASGDDMAAAAAAHVLLVRYPDRAGGLLDRVGAGSSPTRLLAAATAAACLDDPLERVERLLAGTVADTSRGEATVALVNRLPHDSLAVKRMHLSVLGAMLPLAEKANEIGHWPYVMLWYDFDGLADAELSELIQSASSRSLGVGFLGSWTGFTDGSEYPIYHLTPDAKSHLAARATELAERSDSTIDDLRFVVACAAVQLVDAIPLALRLVSSSPTVVRLRTTSSRRYGLRRASLGADLLACLGYLGRAAYEQGQERLGELAYTTLTSAAMDGDDPSTEGGRLVGLAVLGDWRPLLTGLPTQEPRLHTAARNAITLWRPGPCTPGAARDLDQVGHWLVGRLAAGGTLATDVRSTLEEIKELVERQLGLTLPHPE
jgi:hypothetical protein